MSFWIARKKKPVTISEKQRKYSGIQRDQTVLICRFTPISLSNVLKNMKKSISVLLNGAFFRDYSGITE